MTKNLIFVTLLELIFISYYSYSNPNDCIGFLSKKEIVIDRVGVDPFFHLSVGTDSPDTIAIPFKLEPIDDIIFIVRDANGNVVDQFIVFILFNERQIAGRTIPIRTPAIFSSKKMVDLVMEMSVWMKGRGIDNSNRRQSVVELPYSIGGFIEVILTTNTETLDAQTVITPTGPSIVFSIVDGKVIFDEGNAHYIKNK